MRSTDVCFDIRSEANRIVNAEAMLVLTQVAATGATIDHESWDVELHKVLAKYPRYIAGRIETAINGMVLTPVGTV